MCGYADQSGACKGTSVILKALHTLEACRIKIIEAYRTRL